MGFEDIHVVTRDGKEDHVWHGRVSDAYNVGEVPGGGHVTALVLQALLNDQKLANDANVDCVNLNLWFLGSCTANESCVIRITAVKRGKSTSTLNATLHQSGKLKINAIAIFSRYGSQESVLDYVPSIIGGDGEIPRFEECVQVEDFEGWVRGKGKDAPRRSPMSRFRWWMAKEMYEAMESIWLRGENVKTLGIKPSIRSYCALEDENEPITTPVLACLADSCIPVVKLAAPTSMAWVPTLQYHLQFFADPSKLEYRPGSPKVFCNFRTHACVGGYMLEDCEMYDAQTGKIICCTRQTALASGVEQRSKV